MAVVCLSSPLPSLTPSPFFAVPYLWSTGLGRSLSNMGFPAASTILPWCLPGTNSQQQLASKQTDSKPALQDIQDSFRLARQLQPQETDPDFAHARVESLQADVQRAQVISLHVVYQTTCVWHWRFALAWVPADRQSVSLAQSAVRLECLVVLSL